MIKKSTTIFFLFAAFILACGQETKKESSQEKSDSTTPMTIHEDISVAEFTSMYDPNKHILLDVRTPEEWNEGHLENAIHINYYQDSFEDEIKKLDRDKSYFIYCKSGGRSGKTLHKFKEIGFVEAYNIEGGITSLKAEGVTIITE